MPDDTPMTNPCDQAPRADGDKSGQDAKNFPHLRALLQKIEQEKQESGGGDAPAQSDAPKKRPGWRKLFGGKVSAG
jgi:hypothetical protein